MRHEQSRHCRLCHSDTYAIACDARLGDLEERASNAVSIPDANLIIGQADHGEVFINQVRMTVVAELSLPVAIRVHFDIPSPRGVRLHARRDPLVHRLSTFR